MAEPPSGSPTMQGGNCVPQSQSAGPGAESVQTKCGVVTPVCPGGADESPVLGSVSEASPWRSHIFFNKKTCQSFLKPGFVLLTVCNLANFKFLILRHCVEEGVLNNSSVLTEGDFTLSEKCYWIGILFCPLCTTRKTLFSSRHRNRRYYYYLCHYKSSCQDWTYCKVPKCDAIFYIYINIHSNAPCPSLDMVLQSFGRPVPGVMRDAQVWHRNSSSDITTHMTVGHGPSSFELYFLPVENQDN